MQNKSDKDKNHMISLILGIQKIKQSRNRLTDTKNKLVVTGGGGIV